MQLRPDFTRQSENQQMTQDFYNNSELKESVFLPKTQMPLFQSITDKLLFSYPFNHFPPFLEADDSGYSTLTGTLLPQSQ